MLLNAFHIPGTVQKEGSSVHQLLYHVVLAYVGRIVAGYKVCLVNQISRLNGTLAKTQVRHGYAAGLLGVIVKVSLCIHVGIVADDLDGVLIRTNSTVGAQTPELAVNGSFRRGYQRSARI